MSIHKFYVGDSSLDKSLYTCIILNPSDSRYQKVYKVKKKLLVTPPPYTPTMGEKGLVHHKLSHSLLFKEFNFLINFYP